MTNTLLSAHEAMAAGEARVGGKAIGLARLTLAGAPIPDWQVLPAAAFEEHLRRTELADAARAGIDPAAARRVQDAIRSTPLDPGLVEAIRSRVTGRGPMAVRSSVVGEDGHRHSFAGVFDSYLFRQGLRDIVHAIKECWASAFSERALAYRTGKDALPESVSVAVVLQDMVDGDVSGVMFTSNPVTFAADEVVISACWGLGEGIVGGASNTDEFTVSHGGRERSAVVADKDIMVIHRPGPHAQGTREVPVPVDRRRIRCLSPEQVAEMTRQALRIAEMFGEPQDIEWTIRGDELVLLQARPITASLTPALGNWRTVWDNSNIQETFNGVTLPLTFSWAVAVYREVFRETLRMAGVSGKTIRDYEPTLRNMIGLVSGRVYYNINNWYRVLRLAPSFSRNKVDAEKMLGVQHPVDFIEDTQFTWWEKCRNLPRITLVVARLLVRLSMRRRTNRRFQTEVSAALREIDQRRRAAQDLPELLAVADDVLTLFGRWAVPMFNDFYLSRQAGKVRRMIARSIDGDSDEITAGLLAADGAVESVEPTLMLMGIANLIHTNDAWVATLRQGDPRQALGALCVASPEVARALDEFVEKFGDRCMGEAKLENISLRQDRSFLTKVLQNYVADPTLDPSSFERSQRERQRRFETEVFSELPALRRWRLARTLRGARDAIRSRESMRLTRSRVYGLGRAVYTDVGEKLYRAGHLDNPRQVFCLTMDEIAAFAEGRAVTTRLADLARLRDAEFAEYGLEEPPNQFETFGTPYGGRRVEPAQLRAPAQDTDGTLRGTGCCPGEIEGDVRIVVSPHDDLTVAGKILTTVRTDPGWGPLFPGLAGLLVERGSTLSHSAVLARELGIPAVVGIPGLMATVTDGERVRLDGRTGIVQRIARPSVHDRVRALVCTRLGVADVDVHAHLLDYGLDSVRAAELVVELESAFAVSIGDEEAATLSTLDKIVDHIDSKLATVVARQ
jgi:pyruvate,water dikinase